MMHAAQAHEQQQLPQTSNSPAEKRKSRSGRKQLPSIPSDAGAASSASELSSRMIERCPSIPKPNQAYGQFFLEYSIMAEYKQLLQERVPGVYVIPSAKSPLVWFGVLFVRQGLYQDGIFKFSLSIPESYPDGECPRLFFQSPVFHPVINPESGELDIKRAFHKWRRNIDQLWHILSYARKIFYKIDIKSPWNPEASVLYDKDPEMYKRKVSEHVHMSREQVYGPPVTNDPHEIKFSPWDMNLHEDVRQEMLHPQKTTSDSDSHPFIQNVGLSWIQPGSNRVFSKDEAET